MGHISSPDALLRLRPIRALPPIPVGRDRNRPARGIMLALGLSALLWIALALVVPRLW
jgi:hypothetical protein